MSKSTWKIFLTVQILGAACYWLWPLIPSPVGMWLWSTYIVLLFPGNFASGEIVEAIFWNKITLTQMSVVEIPITLAINAVLWIIGFYCIKKIKSLFNIKNQRTV